MRLKIRPRFCLFLIAVMIVVFGASIAVARHDLRAGEAKLAQVQDEYAALQEQLVQLREELAFSQTDEYVERVARDELGLLMPGEIRYVSSGK
ncbi:MAG: septum formation initiator family protein [Clostridia bacterium]|nr:septum formation initiator family protein [Clostridia bacterium]